MAEIGPSMANDITKCVHDAVTVVAPDGFEDAHRERRAEIKDAKAILFRAIWTTPDFQTYEL
jgi:hypothetical protein